MKEKRNDSKIGRILHIDFKEYQDILREWKGRVAMKLGHGGINKRVIFIVIEDLKRLKDQETS